MIKLIATLILIDGLVGCATSIDEWQINAAIDYCKSKGGVDYINQVLINVVTCADGGTHILNKLSEQGPAIRAGEG